MSLHTGKKLHSYEWEELPIDDDVIARVEELAREQDAPIMTDGYPMFEWMPGVPILDEVLPPTLDDAPDGDNADAIILNDNVEEPINDLNLENVQVDDDMGDHNNDIIDDDVNVGRYVSEDESLHAEDTDDDEGDDELAPELNSDTNVILDNIDEHDDESKTNDVPNAPEHNEHDNTENEANVTAIDDTEDDTNSSRGNADIEEGTSSSGRPRRAAADAGIERLTMDFGGKSYSSTKHRQFLMRKLQAQTSITEDAHRIATNVMFTQMSAKKGIKLFGERAVAAMFKEFKQLNEGAVPGKPVFGPQNASLLTPEERRQTLEAVNLIKEKRCGKIKGRTCANGSKQRQYLKEGESVASPTVSTEANISTLVIDAYEGRDVAIFDVPGAFLQSAMPKDKNVHMRLRDEFVDIMCKVNPEYTKSVTYERGRKVLYVKVLQAIYGCIESALLWYEFYTETLVKLGFKVNPYDQCVANKFINHKQCTITWYVDDNKISHVDPKVVDEILEVIKSHFGELIVSRGKEHELLGMKIKIRDDKKVDLSMIDQIQQAIDAFPEELEGVVKSPAARHLWKTSESSAKLSAERSEIFHSITAKLLFITKRVRPDIEPTVAYLTTRVAKSNIDDWQKLKRVLLWLKNTINEVRTIGASDLTRLYTWVDAAYAVHDNMRSQTGGAMSMGYGLLHCRSSKQKLNTKSSTESELVGTSDYVPYNIWNTMFWREQGYEISKNLLLQDNQSAIKMERNGRNSCTGNSRHIDIRHFFVKDRVDKGEIQVEYCPTELMLADYFTKPLQGTLFRRFWDIIMGRTHINQILDDSSYSIKERVENRVQNKENVIEKRDSNKNHVQDKKNVIEKRDSSKAVTDMTWADVVKKFPMPKQDTPQEKLTRE